MRHTTTQTHTIELSSPEWTALRKMANHYLNYGHHTELPDTWTLANQLLERGN